MSSLELEAKFSASRLAISSGSHLAFPSESFKKVVKLSGLSRVYMLYSVLYNFRRYFPVQGTDKSIPRIFVTEFNKFSGLGLSDFCVLF